MKVRQHAWQFWPLCYHKIIFNIALIYSFAYLYPFRFWIAFIYFTTLYNYTIITLYRIYDLSPFVCVRLIGVVWHTEKNWNTVKINFVQSVFRARSIVFRVRTEAVVGPTLDNEVRNDLQFGFNPKIKAIPDIKRYSPYYWREKKKIIRMILCILYLEPRTIRAVFHEDSVLRGHGTHAMAFFSSAKFRE